MLATSSDTLADLSTAAEAAGYPAGPLFEGMRKDQLLLLSIVVGTDVIQQRLVWQAPDRPPSQAGREALQHEHSFPLSSLQEAVEATLARAAAGNFAEPAAVAWQLPAWKGRSYTSQPRLKPLPCTLCNDVCCCRPGRGQPQAVVTHLK